MTEPLTLMIGTTKGLFLFHSEDRKSWRREGPLCDLWSINHATANPVNGTIWAAGGGDFSGAGVWRKTAQHPWTLTRLTDGQMSQWARDNPEEAASLGMEPGQPAPFGERFSALWSICHAHGRLYAGAKPATLLVSDDQGDTWQVVEALTDHPSTATWQPGAAGLTLHTIIPDPADSKRLYVGISAAGVLATEDGGQSWDRRNRLANTATVCDHPHPAAPRDGETGHCVHNMQRAAGVLYQQNHHGVWRSADDGRSWEDCTNGLPSTFGFPIAVHPDSPQTLWTFPLNGDSQGRFPPDAAAAVWRSDDGGQTWAPKRKGLPQDGCFFTVLRQAMATDAQAGLYFGTNTGTVFASLDAGDSWTEIANHLPTVLCVEAVNWAPATA